MVYKLLYNTLPVVLSDEPSEGSQMMSAFYARETAVNGET